VKARKAPITGEQITPTAAKASNSHSKAVVAHTIDSSGLKDRDNDGLLEHSINLQHMWLSEKGQTTGWVEFDLGKVHKLDLIQVWNLNERWLTKRGVKRADISVWTEKTGWKKVLDDFEFDEAEGNNDYDEPILVKLDGIEAQKVRLDELVNLGDTEHIGLSEVQFFEGRDPRAVRPQPANGQEDVRLRGLKLSWMPGLDAVAHNVYFGTDPNKLKLLGKVKDASSAKLSPLAGNTKYYWRIDEIQADGAVVKGKSWSFSTKGLVAWWKFDEGSGTTALDSSGHNNHGTLINGPQWVAGTIGGALKFDGRDDCVDCGNDASLNITKAVTVSAWIKLAATGTDQKVAGNQDDSAGGYKMTVFSNNKVEFEIRTSGNQGMLNRNVSGGTVLESGVWYHVVGLYAQEGNYIRTYVDGNLDRELVTSEVLAPTSGTLKLGREPFSNSYYWNGVLDDVRIYNCALDKAEISAIYSGQTPPAVAEIKLETDQAVPAVAEVPTTDEIETGKGSNWIPVLVIVIIAVVAAGLATLRKKPVP